MRASSSSVRTPSSFARSVRRAVASPSFAVRNSATPALVSIPPVATETVRGSRRVAAPCAAITASRTSVIACSTASTRVACM